MGFDAAFFVVSGEQWFGSMNIAFGVVPLWLTPEVMLASRSSRIDAEVSLHQSPQCVGPAFLSFGFPHAVGPL